MQQAGSGLRGGKTPTTPKQRAARIRKGRERRNAEKQKKT